MGSVVAVVVIDQQIGLVAVVAAAAVVVEVVALAAVDFEEPKSAVAKDLAIDWPVHHLVAAAAAVGFDRVVVAVEVVVLVAFAAFVVVRSERRV